MDNKLPIKISLLVGYINDHGNRSNELIRMGWVKLDSAYHVKTWNFDFTTEVLDSDEYFTGRHTVGEQ